MPRRNAGRPPRAAALLASLAALLLAAPGPAWGQADASAGRTGMAASAAGEEASADSAYAEAFSAARLGLPPPSAALGTEFTAQYRGALPHAAFAVARDARGRSAWAWVSGLASPEAADEAALERCRGRSAPLGAECRIVARDVAVEGAPVPVAPAEARIGPFRASPLHLLRGPRAARGALVWGHGYGGAERDNRKVPAPGYASVLNDSGWDVLRFDRFPGDDSLTTSLPRLVAGVGALRAAGYRRVVLAGQSRGGWQAIMAASEAGPGAVDAVIATAPAAHGEAQRPNNLAAALEDFRRLLAGLPADGPRLLVALFEGDDFDPDPGQRALLVEEQARGRAAPMLALWPAAATGIKGHGGAVDWRFARYFGGCVLTLVQAPEAAAPRGLRRDACGGG